MSTYPQARSVHSITEPAAGTQGTHDPAEASAPSQKLITALPFGVLVVQGTNGYDKVSNTSTAVVGALPVSTLAGDYKNGRYVADDVVAPIRRGYLHVKIDPANKPTFGGTLRVSYAPNKEGWLTSEAANSHVLAPNCGIKLENVYDTVAEVYFSGLPEYPLT
jgi:protoporphyrinogen oxidase